MLHNLSQELPYSDVPYRIWNTRYTVSTFQQLRLQPHRFQVSMKVFSKVRSKDKTTAFIHYRPWRLKNNPSSPTPRLVNYRHFIKFSTVSAGKPVFREAFEEAVKGIRVVSRSFEKFSPAIGFVF